MLKLLYKTPCSETRLMSVQCWRTEMCVVSMGISGYTGEGCFIAFSIKGCNFINILSRGKTGLYACFWLVIVNCSAASIYATVLWGNNPINQIILLRQNSKYILKILFYSEINYFIWWGSINNFRMPKFWAFQVI